MKIDNPIDGNHKNNNNKEVMNNIYIYIEKCIINTYSMLLHKNPKLENKEEDIYIEILVFIFRILTSIYAYKLNLLPIAVSSKNYKVICNYLNDSCLNNSSCKKEFNLFSRDRVRLLEESLSDEIVESVIQEINLNIDFNDFKIEYIGYLFEELLGKELNISGNLVKLIDNNKRKDSGVYFTDINIVSFIVRKTLQPYKNCSTEELLRLKFVDPSMGTGYFLLELIRYLSYELIKKSGITIEEAKTLISQNCIYGVDKNNLAVDICKISLWLEVANPRLTINFLDKKIKCGDSLLYIPYDNLDKKSNSAFKLMSKKLENLRRLEKDLIKEYFHDINLKDNHYLTFNWELNFPEIFLDSDGNKKDNGGFDAVLGNPPWGRIKANIKEFYTYKDIIVTQLQGKDLREFINKNHKNQEWISYEKYIKCYSKVLNNIAAYPNQRFKINDKTTSSDNDLYKYFLELAFNILKPDGRLGFVVPTSFNFSEGASGLRNLYLNNGYFEYLIGFNNKRKIFPIHTSYKFVIMIYEKCKLKEGIKNAMFDMTDTVNLSEDNFSKLTSIYFNSNTIRKCGGNILTIPEVRNQNELNLLRKVYSSFPLLGDKLTGKWNISFNREVDMTNDSDAFVTKESLMMDGVQVSGNSIILGNEVYLPVYEGRMVHQYDYAYKKYISGQGRTATWSKLDIKSKKIVPHYYISKSYIKNIENKIMKPRAAFCDITGQSNQRTVLATLIPAYCVCGNKVPTCSFDVEDIRADLLWIGISNSFIVDWLIRKKMTTTLNFFHWYHIPFPRLDIESDIAKEIILRVAAILSLTSDMDLIWDQLRNYYSIQELQKFRVSITQHIIQKYRTDIECIVSSIFNLTLNELGLVLYSFNGLDKGQPVIENDKQYNKLTVKSSFVTRDVVLNSYSKYLGNNDDLDIVKLFREIEIDIDKNTGAIRNLNERVKEYNKINAIAFNYMD